MAKLIHVWVEMFDGNHDGISWYAYFEGIPTREDLIAAVAAAYPRSVVTEQTLSHFLFDPIQYQNPVASMAGLERWYICQLV